jgi:hypothetical protein
VLKQQETFVAADAGSPCVLEKGNVGPEDVDYYQRMDGIAVAQMKDVIDRTKDEWKEDFR